jgi:hypothetical protein
LEVDIGKIKIRSDKKKKEALDMRWWRKEDKRKQRKNRRTPQTCLPAIRRV